MEGLSAPVCLKLDSGPCDSSSHLARCFQVIKVSPGLATPCYVLFMKPTNNTKFASPPGWGGGGALCVCVGVGGGGGGYGSMWGGASSLRSFKG